MKSKSKKQVPKVRLPKFTLGGSNSYNEGLPSTLQTGTNTQTGNSTTDYMNDKRTGKSKMDTATKYAGYATTAIGGISDLSNIYNNNGTPNDAYKSARSTENSIVSNVPVYGAIHSLTGSVVDAASASTLAGKTDDKGNLVSRSETKADMVGKAFADPFAMIAARGAYEGGWTDFSGNAYADSLEKKAKEQVASNKEIQDSQQKQQDDYNKMYNYYQQQQGLPQAKYGGQMKFAMGGMNMQPNSEVEDNEMITSNVKPQVFNNGGVELASNNPYGTPTYKTNGATHENGGIPMNMAPGSIVNGKTKNPLTGNKFTKDVDIIAKMENKYTKKAESGDKFSNKNAELILPILAQKKDYLNKLQNAIIANKEQAKALRNGQLPQPSMDNEQAEPQGMSEQSEGEVATARYGGMYAKGGIHINPANKGKFTASAQRAGMGTQEFASHVLANKEDYSSTQVKRANFAHNAAGWKHEMGGVQLPYYNTDNNGNPTYANGGNYPAMTNPYHKFKGRIPAYGDGGKSYIDSSETDMQEQADRNAYYDSLSKKNPNNNLQSSYAPGVIGINDSGNTPNNPYQMPDYSKQNQDSYDRDLKEALSRNPNPESDKINWGDVAGNVGNFAAQNAGNIYDLMRKNAPLTSYERAKASYLDSSAAMRAADQENRRAEWGVRNASGGNAGTYLSNRVALGTQNTMNKAQIAQQYANANAGIGNQNAQFNAEIAYREREARDKDAAMKQNINSMAIHNIGSSFGKSTKSGKQDEMDQDTLDLYKEYYKNPEFRAAMKKSTFGSKKSTTKNKKD